jgi:hypothetical protein
MGAVKMDEVTKIGETVKVVDKMNSEDQQLLSQLRETQASIRDARTQVETLAADRNETAVRLLDRGFSLRGIAKEIDVSPPALHIGVTRHIEKEKS